MGPREEGEASGGFLSPIEVVGKLPVPGRRGSPDTEKSQDGLGGRQGRRGANLEEQGLQ